MLQKNKDWELNTKNNANDQGRTGPKIMNVLFIQAAEMFKVQMQVILSLYICLVFSIQHFSINELFVFRSST